MPGMPLERDHAEERQARIDQLQAAACPSACHARQSALSVALQELVVDGFLTNQGVQRYRAVPEMRVRVVEP